MCLTSVILSVARDKNLLMGLEGFLLYPWVIESIARQDEEALHFILE
jgi:hypothetical protein